MKINRPKKTRVLHVEVPIKWRKNITGAGKDEFIYGKYHPGRNPHIEIRSDLEGEELLDTIIHEGIHLIEDVVGQDLPHPLVHALSALLTQYLSPFIVGPDRVRKRRESRPSVQTQESVPAILKRSNR